MRLRKRDGETWPLDANDGFEPNPPRMHWASSRRWMGAGPPLGHREWRGIGAPINGPEGLAVAR